MGLPNLNMSGLSRGNAGKREIEEAALLGLFDFTPGGKFIYPAAATAAPFH